MFLGTGITDYCGAAIFLSLASNTVLESLFLDGKFILDTHDLQTTAQKTQPQLKLEFVCWLSTRL